MVVRGISFPTFVKDADPDESQRTHYAPVVLASVFLTFVIGLGPGAVPGSLANPFYEGLSQEPGRVPPPMDPYATAALFFYQRHSAIALEVRGGLKSSAIGSQRH